MRFFSGCFLALAALSGGAYAADAPPVSYASFVAGATVQPGLIPIITKNGNVYFALKSEQLGADFIESSMPASGLGGFGPAKGDPYISPARLFHFDRVDDKVVLRWPNTIAQVTPGTPQAAAAQESFPSSIIDVVAIAAEDPATGTIVIPASSFLDDISNYGATFARKISNPQHGYHLDKARTFFSKEKAFTENDILHVTQTWASDDPNLIDNIPDPRSVEVEMVYNIIGAPHDGYVPRLADPRIGFFNQARLDFAHDPNASTRSVIYIARWNFMPEYPGKPSNASHPLVFFLSNDIPLQYRDTVRKALLTWNGALERVGILHGIHVEQQPADPNWDPEDVRHNMIRWIDTTQAQFGAEALLVTDPRTGEELNVGVNVDASEGSAKKLYHYIVAPERGLRDTDAEETAFEQAYVRMVVLHESGHDLGLLHNFIGSMAYTAKDLQSESFTRKYGVASSVMEYAPLNLWPKGTPQGEFVQLVLGPYDYYAIKYGYGYIPGAATPEQERPALRRWASQWSNPLYRFASDEDADFSQGHAIDPRVHQFDLTNDPLAWLSVQTHMLHDLMNHIDRYFPAHGESYDELRRAFLSIEFHYEDDVKMPADTIGGEYLSRANAGDPSSGPPLQAIPRNEELRAWHQLATELFSDDAWKFNPNVLTRMTYNEYEPFESGTWAYNPGDRHDISVSDLAARAQDSVLNELFTPLLLQRLADLSAKYGTAKTMSLSDLFTWSIASIFGDIANGNVTHDGLVRRNLQIRFAKRLAALWTSPANGTPPDAQALARASLIHLQSATMAALQRNHIDELTQAHLHALSVIAKQALAIRADISS